MSKRNNWIIWNIKVWISYCRNSLIKFIKYCILLVCIIIIYIKIKWKEWVEDYLELN